MRQMYIELYGQFDLSFSTPYDNNARFVKYALQAQTFSPSCKIKERLVLF